MSTIRRRSPHRRFLSPLRLGLLVVVLVGAFAARADEAVVDQLDAGQFVVPLAVPTSEQPVEVRDYQGEKLGSVKDFRENSIRGVQIIDPATYRLALDGLVDRPQSWSYPELTAMEHQGKLVTIHCVEGWSVQALWEGIPLAALFEAASPQEEANTVVFHAADGYTTSLPLGEILDRNLIIAHRINGIALPAANGFPFQLVAENKWGYKWIKWIVRIELTDDPSIRGFWESRGYSNSGDVDGPMFGD